MICSPRVARGLNLINLALWNKAAITKTCRELANKKDKLWIKCIHSYYIKDQMFANMGAPKQECSMVRKIFGPRSNLDFINNMQAQQRTIIKQVYLQLLGNFPKVPWKGLMCQNQARPIAVFTMWLQVQGRLLTTDKLKNWGVQVLDICCFCNQTREKRYHIFAECAYGRSLWTKLMRWLQIQQPCTSSWTDWHH